MSKIMRVTEDIMVAAIDADRRYWRRTGGLGDYVPDEPRIRAIAQAVADAIVPPPEKAEPARPTGIKRHIVHARPPTKRR